MPITIYNESMLINGVRYPTDRGWPSFFERFLIMSFTPFPPCQPIRTDGNEPQQQEAVEVSEEVQELIDYYQ